MMPFSVPEIEYAAIGDSRVAYQVLGSGPVDLVWIGPWWSHIDGRWEDPIFRHFLRRLADFSRLITFDKRGAGASDRLSTDEHSTWDAWVEDVRAVMAAAGSPRAVVCGVLDSGPVAVLIASRFPELVSQLVLVNSAARFTIGDGYEWGLPRAYAEDFIRATREAWGRGAQLELSSPGRATDPSYREWWNRYQRMSASPEMVESHYRLMMHGDCRAALPAVRVPTLVIHRTEMVTLPLDHGRYLADNIPGATLAELPGSDVPVFSGDADAIIDKIEGFVAGARSEPASLGPSPPPTRKPPTTVESLLEHNAALREDLEQYASELQRTRARAVAAGDSARRDVERDLHDGAQQQLVLLRLKLAATQERIQQQPGSASAMLDEIRTDLDRALAELRDLARGVYPLALETAGLEQALREAVLRAAIPTQLDWDCKRRHPREIEAAVYFSCLEALQNAAKHGGDGTRATIRVAELGGALRFTVTDDGGGFDRAAVPSGAGLANITERLAAVGGSTDIRSEPGRGTTVAGTVPLPD
jgi:signal transduction histidine kinase